MQKSFTKLNAPLTLLLLLCLSLRAAAQDVVLGNTGRAAGKATLHKILEELESRFRVHFSYNASDIQGKFVQGHLSGSLEQQLERTLQPLGLQAVKLGESDYAIRTVKSAAPVVSNPMQAQVTVQGVVTETNGQSIPGVSVSEKGTGNGTITDGQGRFTLRVAGANSILVFRSVGYLSKESAAGRGSLSVQLEQDVRSLEGVVVTALGIKRQEKALGYSIAKLDAGQVATVKEVNLANALSGKVAGVNVRATSSDPGATSLINIRGQSGLSGYNQPLYVVDGVPIAAAVRTPKQPLGQVVVDYGSTISDINPDDIASITVLKGASASALYGSRALNGVILITTKSGGGTKKGLGISVNSSALFDKAWLFPQFQNEFGAGDRAGSDETMSSASWGPKLNDGSKHEQWDSPLDGSGNRIPTDWIAYPNRHKDFFETGVTLTNNIAITGNNKDGSFRLSYTNLTNTGIIPNTDLRRNTVNLAAGYNLSPKVRVSTNLGYANNKSDNRPTYNRGSVSNIVYTTTPNIDIKKLRNYWKPGREGLEQVSHLPGNTDNPYLVAYEFINGYNRDRILGNVEINITLAEGLTLMGRTGMDNYNELREARRPFGGVRNKNGAYGVETENFREHNTDFLLSYRKELPSKDWAFSVSAGANRMDRINRSTSQSSESLVIPELYTIGNAAAGTVRNTSYRDRKRINSVYGMGQVSYKNYVFLDLTARNDWSSTLPAENNSYFYPSASLSLILSDMLKLDPNRVSLAKLRLNYAKVGGDTDPYNLQNTYGFGRDWGTVKRANMSYTLKNDQLKPLQASSYEAGADLRFFKNRLGIDFTYYRTSIVNQILPIQTTMASGYSSKIINVGEVQNKGMEIGLSGMPVDGAVRWEIGLNYTRNRNKVVKLMDGIESYLSGSAEGVRYLIKEGEQMGDMYAQTWETVPDGPYKGQPLVEDGGYVTVNEFVKVGNYNPDFMLGITNTVSYKGFTLNALIDWRQGGQFYSYVAKNLLSDGRTMTTVPGRDPSHGGLAWNDGTNDRTDGMILPGYMDDGSGKYVKNDQITDPENYYGEVYWSFNGRSTFDASYIKLREVSLTYAFPQKMMGKVPVYNLSIAFIARNLFTWTAADQGYDPETAMTISNGSFSPGVGSWSLPYTRAYGVKLGFNF
ncbi:SusC/RagA family TonB-linked outer membrane protein [Chitinophaga lutea]